MRRFQHSVLAVVAMLLVAQVIFTLFSEASLSRASASKVPKASFARGTCLM